jgi:hypothetical protein
MVAFYLYASVVSQTDSGEMVSAVLFYNEVLRRNHATKFYGSRKSSGSCDRYSGVRGHLIILRRRFGWKERSCDQKEFYLYLGVGGGGGYRVWNILECKLSTYKYRCL